MIVVSTSQTELSNLQKIMDEIFGEENLFAILTRRAMHTVRNSSKGFSTSTPIITSSMPSEKIGSESASSVIFVSKLISQQATLSDDQDGRGPYKLDPIHARNYYTPYRHTFANGVTWEPPEGSYPRYSISTLTRMETENRLVFNGEPKAKRYPQRSAGRPTSRHYLGARGCWVQFGRNP